MGLAPVDIEHEDVCVEEAALQGVERGAAAQAQEVQARVELDGGRVVRDHVQEHALARGGAPRVVHDPLH